MVIDQDDFKLWWEFQGLQDNIVYHYTVASVMNSIKDNDILIVDEADVFVYD